MRAKFGLDPSTYSLIVMCVTMVGIASIGKIVGDAWVALFYGVGMIVIIWISYAADRYRKTFKK
jgi:hypothetical protein